jgi:hypothetical protein
MSTLRSDWPSTPDFHPEFGFLCPSPRRRRSMRIVIASVIVGTAIGATIELAVARWRHSDVAPSPAARSMDEALLTEGTAVPTMPDIPAVSARPSATAAATGELPEARPQGFCKETGAKDLAAAFLNPACGPAKPHARHPARTTNRVATVIVGRTDAPPASAAIESKPTATVAAAPSYAAGGVTGKTTASTMQPVEPPTPLAKKPKVGLSVPIVSTPPARRPAQQDAGSIPLAAMPAPARDHYGRPGDVSRAAALLPGFGGPFGGIW